jgi:hypothetical protein
MSVKFKCKQSGTVTEFLYEHDIASMRKHPEYEEVVEKPVAKKAAKTVEVKGEDNGNEEA